MSTFIYARVSTQRQGEHGLSLAEQEDRCRRYAVAKGWNVVEAVREASSGYNKEQRKLKELVERVPNGSSILITTYDRFSRNVLRGVTMIKELAKRDVKVLAVSQPADTLTPSGQYTATILIASGELTSAETGFKVRATFAKRKREGNHVGPAGFGYAIQTEGEGESRKRRKIVNVREQNVMALIKALRDGVSLKRANNLLFKVVEHDQRAPLEFNDGDGSPIERLDANQLRYGEIADLLNDYHVEYRNDKQWTAQSVQRVYQNYNSDERELVVGMQGL